MIWFIIYLVGYALAILLNIKLTLRYSNYKFEDIGETLFVSILSWISFIVMLLYSIDKDTVIFKKKG